MRIRKRSLPFRDYRFWLIQFANIILLSYITLLHANDVSAGIINSQFQGSGIFSVFIFIYLVTLFESAIRFGPVGAAFTMAVVYAFVLPNIDSWFNPEYSSLAITRLTIVNLLALGMSIVAVRDRNSRMQMQVLNEQLKENILEKERYIKLAGEAQENERRRISRDLHDDSLQLLALVTSHINDAIESENPADTHSNMIKAKETIALTSETIRRYCEELRPLLLESMGLVPSVEWIGGELEMRGDIRVLFTTNGKSGRIEPDKEIHIFRVMQEAFNNIERHSQASAVDVIWDFKEDHLAITVRDNGIGIWNSEGRAPRQLGIQGMHERVELVGGTLAIESQPGFGTKILLTIPTA